MSQPLTLLSNAIALSIAILYTLAGQAHYTDRFTPDLAANVDTMTPNSHRAFWFLHLTYPQIQALFGAFDLIAAACLYRPSTRNIGLALAIFGFGGGLYGQWYNDAEMGMVGAMTGLAVLGWLTAPRRS
ncbi:uncharacterized protein AB675_9593 [Cyphellophora attinorum]|uniref:Uncharacterized protein n=1 Tax=Cyphellophora attinorum TaxID=1664694 RepID=A0A0N1HDJ1_9EURO|nr:uncharacterized protein AB675_9593 [Phialophora attinorum]KPI42504.1 hypothetical protein AB675_9593 [Phialophora attinorum]